MSPVSFVPVQCAVFVYTNKHTQLSGTDYNIKLQDMAFIVDMNAKAGKLNVRNALYHTD